MLVSIVAISMAAEYLSLYSDHPKAVERQLSPLQYDGHTFEVGQSRRLSPGVLSSLDKEPAANPRKPIRIHLEYVWDEIKVEGEQLEFLQRLNEAAKLHWEKTLSVDRVAEPMRISATCKAKYPDGTCAKPWEQPKCGDAGLIPLKHMKSGQHMYCTDYYGKPDHSSNACDTTNFEDGDGEAADFVLYVVAWTADICNDGTMAYASGCVHDQYDRPTVGFANYCPNHMDSSPKEWDDQFATAVHEIGHALGFTSGTHAYFRG